MYFSTQKKRGPETDESKGYDGHHRSGDGAHPMRLCGHQIASKMQCEASGKGGWAELGKLYLILAYHVSPRSYLLVVLVVSYHSSTKHMPDRPPQPLPWQWHPLGSCPTAAPPFQEDQADPVLPISAKTASQNGAPSPFFLF